MGSGPQALIEFFFHTFKTILVCLITFEPFENEGLHINTALIPNQLMQNVC